MADNQKLTQNEVKTVVTILNKLSPEERMGFITQIDKMKNLKGSELEAAISKSC